MCEIDLTPCPSCGRRYGHLDDCRIKALHLQLDEMIREHGENIAFLPNQSSDPISDNPREYGVTITADVEADNPEEAKTAFIDELAIGNTDGLTFHVESLYTGSEQEL